MRGSGTAAPLVLALLGGVPAPAPKPPPSPGPGTRLIAPSRIEVTTSRGDFDLLLYAPPASAVPRGADPMPPPLPVLMVSGEGGWRSFDDRIASWLASAGCRVGGIDAMKFFWKPRDDRHELAVDLLAFASALARADDPSDAPVILAGFSFGADIGPWVGGEAGFRRRLRGLVMIAPDEIGSLRFRLSEILGFEPTDHTFRVADALKDTAGVPTVFIHGEKDSDSAAPALAAGAAGPKRLQTIPGADHHFSGREEELRQALESAIHWLSAATGADGKP